MRRVLGMVPSGDPGRGLETLGGVAIRGERVSPAASDEWRPRTPPAPRLAQDAPGRRQRPGRQRRRGRVTPFDHETVSAQLPVRSSCINLSVYTPSIHPVTY